VCSQSAQTSNRFVNDSAIHAMYLKSNVEDNFDIIERLVEVADKKNVKVHHKPPACLLPRDDRRRVRRGVLMRHAQPAQVALGWLLSKPNVTAPIVGATKLYQLEEAVAAVQVRLTADEVAYLEAPYKPHPVLGNLS
jgi:diketogulonate reductase-like aldo/keto reductase